MCQYFLLLSTSSHKKQHDDLLLLPAHPCNSIDAPAYIWYLFADSLRAALHKTVLITKNMYK